MSPSNSIPEHSNNVQPVGGSPPDSGGYESGSEAEDEQPSTSTGVPRRGFRSRQQPDQYTAVRSVRDGCQTAPHLDTAAAVAILLLTMSGLCKNGTFPFPNQVQVTPSNLGWFHHC